MPAKRASRLFNRSHGAWGSTDDVARGFALGARMTSHGPARWVGCADDVARAGAGPALRPCNLAQSGVRRAVRPQAGRARCLSGVETAIRLPLDSVGPPAGPLTPRFALRDGAVAFAESRPRTGPEQTICPHGHVFRDMSSAPGCPDAAATGPARHRRSRTCPKSPAAPRGCNGSTLHTTLQDMSEEPDRAPYDLQDMSEEPDRAPYDLQDMSEEPCRAPYDLQDMSEEPCRAPPGHVRRALPRPEGRCGPALGVGDRTVPRRKPGCPGSGGRGDRV